MRILCNALFFLVLKLYDQSGVLHSRNLSQYKPFRITVIRFADPDDFAGFWSYIFFLDPDPNLIYSVN